jgi:radical SAM-linked protein
MKKNGACRKALLEHLSGFQSFWISPRHSQNVGISKGHRKTLRAVFPDFSTTKASTAFPVPVLQPVQNHGSVEIMRGCPNGCRFCHAGYYYRPQRIKAPEIIKQEVRELVEKAGHREITLASLSSGDYPDIVGLFTQLNKEWNCRSVSFQLPSLKVDSFTLPLLAEVAQLRKSGLTFAVETPIESWQRSVNKVVSFDKIVSIIKEAKRYGFKSAKFYFMIGLPLPERGRGEGEAIVQFLSRLMAEAPLAMNVNIGTFVPKPHTAYERVGQIGEEEALQVIYLIKDRLRHFRSISISYHSPFSSLLEGIISRGGDDVGELLFEAHRRGAGFEAWDDQVDRALWRQLLEDFKTGQGRDYGVDCLSEPPTESALPWDDINLFVSKSYFKEEMSKSMASTLTGACEDECDHPCGSCNDRFKIVHNIIHHELSSKHEGVNTSADPSKNFINDHSIDNYSPEKPFSWDLQKGEIDLSDPLQDRRLIVSFKKVKSASLYPLHSISGAFMRALTMLNLPVRHSEGFNPLPKMELNQPLALGIESLDEIAALWLLKDLSELECNELFELLNKRLPAGLELNRLRQGKKRSEGKKSIGSLYNGSIYSVSFFDSKDKDSVKDFLKDFPIEYDENEHDSLSLYLADSRGAERNAVKLVSSALGDEKVLNRCRIVRDRCYAEFDWQKRAGLSLFEAL